ncbi:MAG TPA: M14 family metallopeptidase [Candidatus Xenobia bacterium]|jgi:murein tripeptide amidase MpaA
MEYDPSQCYRYEELTGILRRLEARYPDLVKLQSIGQTPEGRDLWLVEITQRATGPGEEKPACWVDGNTHAAELAGSAAALHVAWTLATRYGHDPEVTWLVDTRVFYILPRLSPDGAEHCLSKGDFIRSSPRPYPEEDYREGLIPQDVNGDGLVLQMRLESRYGEWKVSPEDPRLLVRRRPDDRLGPFYHVYREGLMENWDRRRIDVPPLPFGLDFNRNYPFEWAPEHQQKGAGPYPLSEPETRAVVEFISTHPNISIVHTFHTYSAVILRPLSTRPDTDMADLDLAIFKSLGARGTDITGYPCVSTYHDFRYHPKELIKGGFDDWCYDHAGIFSFTTELWSIGKAAGLDITDHIKFLSQRTDAETLAILRFNDREELDGFVPWTPFDHPQLGPVDIGGWKLLSVWQNPPPRYLPTITEAASRWVLATAAATPLLEIERFVTEELGSGDLRLRKVTLGVANAGWLPTHGSEKALSGGMAPAPRVVLEVAEEAEILIGKSHLDLPHLAGAANVVADTTDNPVYFRGVSQSHRQLVQWLVRGEGHISVKVTCPRAGTVRAEARAQSQRKAPVISIR